MKHILFSVLLCSASLSAVDIGPVGANNFENNDVTNANSESPKDSTIHSRNESRPLRSLYKYFKVFSNKVTAAITTTSLIGYQILKFVARASIFNGIAAK